MASKFKFIGVDGCSAGWISVALTADFNWELKIIRSVRELIELYLDAELILVDIPIGLRDKGPEPRLCDVEARKLLTRIRSSSIFPTPCRAVLGADSYQKAKKININLTGKGLSKQTWFITSKIKDVDLLLQNNKRARKIIVESHPELCFMAFNDNLPLRSYKKTDKGLKERLNLLHSHLNSSYDIFEKTFNNFDKYALVKDDILDALVLALSAAKRIDKLRFIPENFEFDSTELPMRMAIPLI